LQADLAGASDEDVLAHALGAEPAPDFCAQVAEEFSRLLDHLGTDELRSIAIFKMEGYTDEEIAARLGKSVRTVVRKVSVIRNKWRAWEKLS
jgi:DNA-directed RNA polymerase specialized sigma24 family protein